MQNGFYFKLIHFLSGTQPLLVLQLTELLALHLIAVCEQQGSICSDWHLTRGLNFLFGALLPLPSLLLEVTLQEYNILGLLAKRDMISILEMQLELNQ
jgi:hypothetical protein